MIDVSFEIDGRKVSPNQIGNELEKAMLKKLQAQVQRKVSGIRCPTHGEKPRVVAKGRSIENLSWEVFGCCDDLIAKVKRSL